MRSSTSYSRAAEAIEEEWGQDSAEATKPASMRESLSNLACNYNRNIMEAMDRRTTPYGLTVSGWRFLRSLYVNDGCSQMDLTKRLGFSAPTTARALDRLERDGFVRRRPNAADRRKIEVVLTPKARRLLVSALIPCSVEVNELAVKGFNAKEKQMLKELMIRSIRILEADKARYLAGYGKSDKKRVRAK